MADDKNNPFGEPTTGHLWDDNLCELTNPPPKWWMMALHASWIFVVLYGIIYPMVPLATGATSGLTGWTSIGEFKKGVAEVEGKRAKYEEMLAGMSAQEMLASDDAVNYIERAGKVLFGDKCAACHGSGGQGNPGFPSLADNDWLYGGDINTIAMTITNGRQGMMPKMGGAQLTDAEIGTLADAIVGGTVTSEPLYMSKGCVGCHGVDGKGMAALGSANLVDQIWRFAESDQRASVAYTITHGVNDTTDPMTRNAVMPAFKDMVSETDIKKLAVYVHRFGGGQ